VFGARVFFFKVTFSIVFFTFAVHEKQSFHITNPFADFIGNYGFSNQAQLFPFIGAVECGGVSS
jgi:hypothetical protein